LRDALARAKQWKPKTHLNKFNRGDPPPATSGRREQRTDWKKESGKRNCKDRKKKKRTDHVHTVGAKKKET